MNIDLYKEVYQTTKYKNVVDTQFKQLIPAEEPVQETLSVQQFFELYEKLFYEIPLSGDTNSHEYLAKRSSEYLGGEIITDNEKALLEEINRLREQLLIANKSITDISTLI